MFKEFSEYDNPLEKDYDITSSLKDNNYNQYSDELLEMVGILEDGEWSLYGLSYEEYLNPTKETVDKVRNCLENNVIKR